MASHIQAYGHIRIALGWNMESSTSDPDSRKRSLGWSRGRQPHNSGASANAERLHAMGSANRVCLASYWRYASDGRASSVGLVPRPDSYDFLPASFQRRRLGRRSAFLPHPVWLFSPAEPWVL